jgi:hypothetical protein
MEERLSDPSSFSQQPPPSPLTEVFGFEQVNHSVTSPRLSSLIPRFSEGHLYGTHTNAPASTLGLEVEAGISLGDLPFPMNYVHYPVPARPLLGSSAFSSQHLFRCSLQSLLRF